MVKSQGNWAFISSNRLYESADEGPAASELEVGSPSYAATVATSRNLDSPSSSSLTGTSDENMSRVCVSALLMMSMIHFSFRILRGWRSEEGRADPGARVCGRTAASGWRTGVSSGQLSGHLKSPHFSQVWRPAGGVAERRRDTQSCLCWNKEEAEVEQSCHPDGLSLQTDFMSENPIF